MSGGDVGDQVLEPGAVGRSVGVAQLDLVGAAGLAAEDAEGGSLGRSAVAEDACLRTAVLEGEHRLDAEAAAPVPGACGVGQVLETVEEMRVDDLEHLGVLGGDRAARGDQADVVVAVRAERPAAAALASVDQDVDIGSARPGRVARDDRGEQVIPAGGHLAWDGRRERHHHDGGDLVGEMVAEPGRGWEAWIHEASFGGDDVDAAHDPVVVRQLLVGDHEEGDHHRRDRDRERRVHVARHLVVGAGEVERRLLAVDRDRQPDRRGQVVVDAVVVDVPLGPVDAVGNPLDHTPGRLLGRIEQAASRAPHGRDPIAGEEGLDLTLADGARADHRAHVLGDDVEANVAEDEVPDVVAAPAAFVELERRDPQALLPQIGRVRVVGAGDGAADVGLVGGDHDPAELLALVEDRLGDLPVGELVATGVRVVVENDVTLEDVAPEGICDRAHAGRGRVAEHGDVLGLLEQDAVLVVDAEREVAALDEQRRAGAPLDHHAHALADRLQPVGDHGGEDGIGAHAPAFRVRTKLPEASSLTSEVSGTTIVVVAVSTTTGPSAPCPGSIRSPSITSTSSSERVERR